METEDAYTLIESAIAAILKQKFESIIDWKTEDSEEVILQSIYPANAWSLLEDGYHFSNIGGPMLFGSQSVRMEKADTVRIHAAADTGLYVMIVPKSLASKVAALSRSLQLVSYPD